MCRGKRAYSGLEDLDVRAAVGLGARLERSDVLHLLERHSARLHCLHAPRRQLIDEPVVRATEPERVRSLLTTLGSRAKLDVYSLRSIYEQSE